MEKLPLRFQVLDESVSIETEELAPAIRFDEVLPALRVLDDAAIGIAARKDGQRVTCAKGCAACCRMQLVPITPTEAYALLRIVESLPAERASELRARFSDRVARLEAAGLADFFREADPFSKAEPMRENMTRYFELGLACPFLEDDACSVYESRPFACREHLVTTPKELCDDPLTQPVRTVPRILGVGQAVLATAAELGCGGGKMIPLVLALEYAQAHREELERTCESGRALTQAIACTLRQAYERGSLVP